MTSPMRPLFTATLIFVGFSPILAGNRFRRANGYSQGGGGGGDMSAIPGNPGQDYPIFGPYPPPSNFRCAQRLPGYYADTQTRCQAFHICEAGGKDSMFLCPNGTLFNQKYFVCDWWYNVNCGDAPNQYGNNANLFQNVPAVAGFQGSPSGGRGGRNQGGAGGYGAASSAAGAGGRSQGGSGSSGSGAGGYGSSSSGAAGGGRPQGGNAGFGNAGNGAGGYGASANAGQDRGYGSSSSASASGQGGGYASASASAGGGGGYGSKTNAGYGGSGGGETKARATAHTATKSCSLVAAANENAYGICSSAHLAATARDSLGSHWDPRWRAGDHIATMFIFHYVTKNYEGKTDVATRHVAMFFGRDDHWPCDLAA